MMAFPFSDQPAPPFDRRLHSDYRASVYRCQDFALRPGVPHPAFDEFLRARGYAAYAFLTAYNPFSDAATPLHLNLARSRVLAKWVEEQKWNHLPAVGTDPNGKWDPEIGLFLFDADLRDVLHLASGFGQHAIVYGEIGGVPEVLWCVCNLCS